MDGLQAERLVRALERIADALEAPAVVSAPEPCGHPNQEPAPGSTFGSTTMRCADCKEPL